MGFILPFLPAIIGAAGTVAGSALANKSNGGSTNGTTDEARRRMEGKAIQIPTIKRVYKPLPAGYRPGIDPLYNMYEDQITGYRDLTQPLTAQSMAAATGNYSGYAAGGAVDESSTPEESMAQGIVMDAMAALHGKSADPKSAISRFIEYFGQDEYQDLRASVLGGAKGHQGGGVVRGPGGGMDDMIPAKHPSNKILLSDGEFVIPADVVSHLGDGSTDAGAKKLEAMMHRVRTTKTGTPTQPGKIKGKVLPA